jgi:hypothetical protein
MAVTEPGTSPNVLWDTLRPSAQPLRGRSDILVAAQVELRIAGGSALMNIGSTSRLTGTFASCRMTLKSCCRLRERMAPLAVFWTA